MISQSAEQSTFPMTLRVIFNLFNCMKDYLKVQLEVFFKSIHLRIIDSQSYTPIQKELVMESMVDFCREPTLMLDLYTNVYISYITIIIIILLQYDCDVGSTNLFEDLCNCLCGNCEPKYNESLNNLHILAFDGLLAILSSIASRCIKEKKNYQLSMSNSSINDSDSENEDFGWLEKSRNLRAEDLRKRRTLKVNMKKFCEKFNSKPGGKEWLQYCEVYIYILFIESSTYNQ